jgi:putative salt-induced outer membrane protein YdiY
LISLLRWLDQAGISFDRSCSEYNAHVCGAGIADNQEGNSMSVRCRLVLVAVLLSVIQMLGGTACFGKVNRHDTVIMKNGDRLTGEVKRLEQGILYIETDYFSGSVGVDWLQVEKVESTATYQVILSGGKRLTGTISKVAAEAAADKDFTVRAVGNDVPVSATDVVQIESQKQNFWRQLKGSIDLGYNFTSGNNQSSLSTDANAVYVAQHWAAGASYTASYNGQTSGTNTNLFETQAFGERFLNRNSFVLGLSDFLHSSQQDLQLRTTLGGGYGRYLKRTNQNELRWLIGVDYSQASYQSGMMQPVQKNAELLLGVQYQLFQFDRYTLQSQMLVFPGLSDFGRVRFTTNNTLSVKLSNNFYWNFSFWDNFDSRPPLNAQRNATGLSTGLGWKF